MKRILLLLSIPLCTMAMEIEVPQENLFVPRSLGQVSVFKTEEGFAIEKDGERTSVTPYRVESTLRKMDNQQLTKFLTAGYLSVQKSSDGEYGLESRTRVKGGGPIAGLCAAWIVRSVMYTTGAIAATTVTAAATVGGGPLAPVTATTTAAQIAAAAPSYIATTEGAATLAGIIGLACVWLP